MSGTKKNGFVNCESAKNEDWTILNPPRMRFLSTKHVQNVKFKHQRCGFNHDKWSLVGIEAQKKNRDFDTPNTIQSSQYLSDGLNITGGFGGFKL